MGHYSIKELEKLSGVKAHTIRIWEQRYGLLHPDRTDTNIRTYSDEELKHLLNVSLLANHGYKISKISALSRNQVKQELSELLVEANIDSLPLGDQINGLIIAMLEMDEDRFNGIYSSARDKMSFESLMLDLFYPFLRKVGLMWGTDQANPAQEHFVSNIIRRKMLAELDKIPLPSKESMTLLLFLREGELHEIGLIMADLILRSRGINTVYLGANVPMSDVIAANQVCKADGIVTFFMTPQGEERQTEYLSELADLVQVPVYFSSLETNEECADKKSNLNFVADIPSLLETLSIS